MKGRWRIDSATGGEFPADLSVRDANCGHLMLVDQRNEHRCVHDNGGAKTTAQLRLPEGLHVGWQRRADRAGAGGIGTVGPPLRSIRLGSRRSRFVKRRIGRALVQSIGKWFVCG